MNQLQFREENFYYTTGWSDAMAAAGAAAIPQINIAADASFKCYYYTLSVRQGAANAEVLVANWAGTVQISESQVGKTLFNIAAPAVSIAGDGQLTYALAPPRIYAANTTVIVTFTSNVVTRTQCCLTMHGAKLYRL